MAQIVQQNPDAADLINMIDTPNPDLANFTMMSPVEVYMLDLLVANTPLERIFTELTFYQKMLVLPSAASNEDELYAALAASDMLHQTLMSVATHYGIEAAEDLQERLNTEFPIRGLPQEALDHVTKMYKERREARNQ